MSGMPLAQALLLLVCFIALVALTQARLVQAFLAIILVATVFGLASGFSTAFVGKAFGAGFAQTIASPGLVIVAAGFVAALADATGAAGWSAAKLNSWRYAGATRWPALCGLVAGLAASPASAFALLTPLLRAFTGGAKPGKRGAAAATLALAISASHGLALVSPVPIAAAAILGAPWSRVALFGVPLAVLLAGIGAAWSRRLAVADAPPQTLQDAPDAANANAWSAAVLVLAAAVPLALLIVQSLGDIPSEPLGGGTAREMVIGVGRPLVLLLVGIGIMVIGNARIAGKCLADDAWSARVLGNVAGPLLAVGAAGGFQRLCQETGMAELLGEQISAWHLSGAGGLFVLFLVAATVKTLQGSSLVAAITAAGIAQSLLIPFGLDAANARALAALAVGAGTMTATHVNDDFFWLVSLTTGIRPLRAVAVLTIGTLLQGIVAVAFLTMIAALIAN